MAFRIGSLAGRYGLAVASVVLTQLLRWQLVPILGQRLLFAFFALAVVVSALFGGLGPGLLATALGALTAVYFGMPPYGSLAIRDPEDWIVVALFLVVGGLISGVSGARDRAEAAMRESEQRFRQVAETVPSIIWTAAPDGTITYVNERWFRFTGITPEENAQGWIDRVLHPEDRQRCIDRWLRALKDGAEYEIEVRNRRHDGEYRWFLTRAVPQRDGSGQILAWFGTATDIHDSKLAEAALMEADRRKDEFLALLAHELRNPLAPIRNSAEILKRIGTAVPGVARARDVIDRQVRHMARLLDDLLDISRITRDKVPLRNEPLDLSRVVRDTAEDLRGILEAAGLNLTLDLPGAPLPVSGDPTRLAQVVGNLLQNSAKFTDRGGRVSIALGQDDDGAILSVQDSGIGIGPELMPQLFQPFIQADGSLERARGGLGLGLALARALVELHGGSIQARSGGPGLGTEFVVRLPLAHSSRPGIEAARRYPAGSGAGDQRLARDSKPRVLLVEDNPDAAESLRDLLEGSGCAVEVAATGPEAVARAASFSPDVVLCDLGLPGMDGYGVAEALRGIPATASARLIALSGYGQEADQRRSRAAGFDLHLTKPVEFNELRRLLDGDPGAGR